VSIRTIIEINHDQLAKLKDDPEWGRKLYDCLATYGWRGTNAVFTVPPGARVLTDRHHSDDLWIGLNRSEPENFS
jgi:hypothetical protein